MTTAGSLLAAAPGESRVTWPQLVVTDLLARITAVVFTAPTVVLLEGVKVISTEDDA